MMTMHAGWLADLTNWLLAAITAVFLAAVDFLKDLVELWFDAVVSMWIRIIDALPSVDFLDGFTLCGILSFAGPTVGWVLVEFHLVEGLAVIGGGFIFYFARKLLTLGQW